MKSNFSEFVKWDKIIRVSSITDRYLSLAIIKQIKVKNISESRIFHDEDYYFSGVQVQPTDQVHDLRCSS